VEEIARPGSTMLFDMLADDLQVPFVAEALAPMLDALLHSREAMPPPGVELYWNE